LLTVVVLTHALFASLFFASFIVVTEVVVSEPEAVELDVQVQVWSFLHDVKDIADTTATNNIIFFIFFSFK
jgi:hypothetical protein